MNEYALGIAAIAAPLIVKIVCFVLGYLVVRLGYRLLEQGVRGEFKFKGSVAGARADLVSASPGLLFLLLGVILIGYAMSQKRVADVFVPRPVPSAPPASAVLPPPPPPGKPQ